MNACSGCNKNKTCPRANESDGFEVCEEREEIKAISERAQHLLGRLINTFSQADCSNLEESGGSMETEEGLILFDTSWMDKDKLFVALEQNFPAPDSEKIIAEVDRLVVWNREAVRGAIRIAIKKGAY